MERESVVALVFSVPASPHFVGEFLWVKAQELRHFGVVLAKENQFTTLPVLPSRPVNTKLARRLAVDQPCLRRAWSSRWAMAVGAGKGSSRGNGGLPASIELAGRADQFPIQHRKRLSGLLLAQAQLKPSFLDPLAKRLWVFRIILWPRALKSKADQWQRGSAAMVRR